MSPTKLLYIESFPPPSEFDFIVSLCTLQRPAINPLAVVHVLLSHATNFGKWTLQQRHAIASGRGTAEGEFNLNVICLSLLMDREIAMLLKERSIQDWI